MEMLTTKNSLQGKFRSEKFTSTMSLKTELIEKIYICTLYGYMPEVSSMLKIYTHVCQSDLHVHSPFIYVGTFLKFCI